MALIMVDLPAPFGPMMPMMPGPATSKLTSSTTGPLS
jgi:hypothetical protein